jgi:hypothetical protein
MRRGDFAAAWAVSDRILQQRVARREDCSGWPRHLQFLWDGRPLAGQRVLVHCYHGLGDTLQFVRLLDPLRDQVAHLTLRAQPVLLELLRSVRGIDHLLALHEGAPDVERDVDIELMELPHAMRLALDSIPCDVPYIHASRARPAASDELLHVGLVWRSGEWVPERSIPERQLARLADVAGIKWYSLQYPSQPLPFAALDVARQNICIMAAQIRALDLVIAVDTMAAHLAGALGMPVWTLLHEDCDWRWMAERSDSPWYPTMRLFRQRACGGWDAVMDNVVEALRVSRRAGFASSPQPSQDSRARYSLSRL